MTRTALASTLLLILAAASGCGGSRETASTTTAPVSSAGSAAPVSSSVTTPVTTTTTVVTWDTPFTASPAVLNDSAIAMHLMGPGQVLVGSPLGTVRILDLAAGTETNEGSYGSVSSFADAGGQTFIGTGQPFFMQGGQGEVFVRDAQGNYSVSLDHPLTAIAVVAMGADVYAFASDYGTGVDATVSRLSANARTWAQDIATFPAAQINKAVVWRNEVWAAGSDNALNGTLRLFHGVGATFTESRGLPSSLTGTVRSEVEITTDLRAINGELYLSSAVVDPTTGNVITGAIYKTNDGIVWTTLLTTPRDAPMAIALHQGDLFTGLISGEVQVRDAVNGTFLPDAGVPTSTGVMSMLELDADTLLVGVRGASGAEVLRRLTTTTSTALPGTTGTTTTPPAPTTTYTADVKPILTARCAACHNSTANAAYTAYPLTLNNDAVDHTQTVNRVNLQTPDASLLLTKARGQAHGGGSIIAAGSAEHTTLIQWVQGGAAR